MSRRKQLLCGVLFIVLIVWPLSISVSAWKEHPFQAGKELAAKMANWPAEDVWFRGGSYSTLPFVFFTEVKIGIATERGEQSAKVEFLHVPLLGIRSVSVFERWQVTGPPAREA